MKNMLSAITNIIVAIGKLIKVKSIMSIALTIVFCVLALRGEISPTEFITIFATIVGFYYGTQKIKE